MALWDRYEWEQALDGAAEKLSGANTGGLLYPKACITHPGGDQYVVAIAWRSPTAMANPTSSTCGQDAQISGAYIYDDGDGDTDYNEHRQVLVISTIIEPI
jgi:hypothetical protein